MSSDYEVVEIEGTEEKKLKRKVISKSDLQWFPKHYPAGKFDYELVKARIEKFQDAGDKLSVKVIKHNIKRVVRDNPHYAKFADLL
tara:strand:+ start:241 stop:498 length:258 start_codon:yes stop_codon:yes gene_type:complete